MRSLASLPKKLWLPLAIGAVPLVGGFVIVATAPSVEYKEPERAIPTVRTIEGKPTWLAFSAETGAITGTPTDADVGDTADITISVTDGRDTRSVGPFKIKIRPKDVPPTPNSPPTISGVPANAVTINQAYSFQPTASDPNTGDTLRFAISGERQVEVVVGREALESLAPIAKVGEVREGELRQRGAILRGLLAERHQAIRLGEWQRLEQDGVDDAENRGVAANPEREREDGDRAVGGLLPQHARPVAHVPPETIPEHGPLLVITRYADRERVRTVPRIR